MALYTVTNGTVVSIETMAIGGVATGGVMVTVRTGPNADGTFTYYHSQLTAVAAAAFVVGAAFNGTLSDTNTSVEWNSTIH